MLRSWTVDLKTPKLYAVTAEAAELNNKKKSQKDTVYFQPEDDHETRIAKREKSYGKKVIGSNTS